jgi:hypothetical protein
VLPEKGSFARLKKGKSAASGGRYFIKPNTLEVYPLPETIYNVGSKTT